MRYFVNSRQNEKKREPQIKHREPNFTVSGCKYTQATGSPDSRSEQTCNKPEVVVTRGREIVRQERLQERRGSKEEEIMKKEKAIHTEEETIRKVRL